MKLRQHQKKHKTESTIALINIVFLMLIFFLVAGTVAAPVGDLVEPPKLETLPIDMPESDLLQITKEGEFYWKGERSNLDELITRFQGAARADIKLMADRQLNALKLVRILDKLRNAGVKDIKLITIKGRG